jgi:hypothetical protein
MSQLLALRFDRPEAWPPAGMLRTAGSGRGAIARVGLGDGSHAVVKQMRRGGLFGPVWRDRFARRQRLLDNLRAPLEALARDIPTGRPVALLLLSGPPLLWRAWLATEEIPAARDLCRRLAGPDPPDRPGIEAVAVLVRRLHDRGIDHRDLNLGNLLLSDSVSAAPRAFVVDLDRARVRGRPIGAAARMRALQRLERSAVKLFGERPLEAFDLRRTLYEAYAGDDPRWIRLAARARKANRLWIRLHRLGWTKRPTG